MNMFWCCSIFVFVVANFFCQTIAAYMGAKMGVAQDLCDDAKTNLTVDWDYSFTAYTCSGLRRYPTNPNIQPFYFMIPNFNPKTDQVYHYCMNSSILYKDTPPIRGHHRPLWAKWGEYLYLPAQRWLHNLEHGSIVMLYHPCVDEHELNKLRGLVTSCLYRHIITPYNKLTNDRPLALISWGAKLEMNIVDAEQVIQFMKKHAHNAPEDLSKQGQFDEMLINPSAIVNDIEDSVVCPWAPDTYYTPDAAAKQYDNHQQFGFFQDITNFLPLTRSSLRRASGDLKQQERNFMEPLLLADRFNGPRQAYDVLPPFARLPVIEQPHYVAAGTFLGSNPMQPLMSVYRPEFQRLPPWVVNSLLASRQDLPLTPPLGLDRHANLALDLRTLARLIALVSLLRSSSSSSSSSSLSTKTVLPGLLPHGIKIIDPQDQSSSLVSNGDNSAAVTLIQGLLSLLMGNFSGESKASGRPLAYPLSALLKDNYFNNRPKFTNL